MIADGARIPSKPHRCATMGCLQGAAVARRRSGGIRPPENVVRCEILDVCSALCACAGLGLCPRPLNRLDEAARAMLDRLKALLGALTSSLHTCHELALENAAPENRCASAIGEAPRTSSPLSTAAFRSITTSSTSTGTSTALRSIRCSIRPASPSSTPSSAARRPTTTTCLPSSESQHGRRTIVERFSIVGRSFQGPRSIVGPFLIVSRSFLAPRLLVVSWRSVRCGAAYRFYAPER